MRWISHFKSAPRRLFLTHGEEAVALKLAAEISQKLGYNTHVPEYPETVELL
jgi:metallo-beta-lactamase family protein